MTFKASIHTYEVEKFLTDVAYVNLGLIPVSYYPDLEVGSLQRCLSELDPDAALKAKRKFRKLLRKSLRGGRKNESFRTRQSKVKWHIINNFVRAPVTDNDE